jgi:hypothetical protein
MCGARIKRAKDDTGERPEDLRELARRTRFIASALSGSEREHMLACAHDLEEKAQRLTQAIANPLMAMAH